MIRELRETTGKLTDEERQRAGAEAGNNTGIALAMLFVVGGTAVGATACIWSVFAIWLDLPWRIPFAVGLTAFSLTVIVALIMTTAAVVRVRRIQLRILGERGER